MQRLLASAVWDADLVRDELRAAILEQLGDQEAIVVIDETSFPKRGKSQRMSPVSTAAQPNSVRIARSASSSPTSVPKDTRCWIANSTSPNAGSLIHSAVTRQVSQTPRSSRPNVNWLAP